MSAVPNLRLGHRLEPMVCSHENGPGRRACLWVQGCSLRCTGRCLNPELLPPSGGHLYRAVDVLDAIADRHREACLEGVTILGGEPTDQAVALAWILERVKAFGLSTMVYTGRSFEELQACLPGGALELLAATDVLVDGPFRPKLHEESLIWRGSSNQRLLCLTRHYSPDELERALHRQGRTMAYQQGAQAYVSGPQSPESLSRLVEGVLGLGGKK